MDYVELIRQSSSHAVDAVVSPAGAGVLGAFSALRFTPGISTGAKIFNVICGSAFAVFGAPGVMELLHLNSIRLLCFLSLILGLFGMSLADAIFKALKEVEWSKIASSWLTRKG